MCSNRNFFKCDNRPIDLTTGILGFDKNVTFNAALDKRVEEFKSEEHSLFTLGRPWKSDRVTLGWAIASLSQFLQGNNQIKI